MAKPHKLWSGSEWVNVSSFASGTSGDFLTPAAAASVYFPISSSVSNFGTIKTIPATENVVADLITDELTFAADNGIILNATASVDQLTISTNATPFNTASAIVMRDGGGSFDITSIDFDTTASGVSAIGRLTWDDGEGTLSLGVKNGNIALKLGQEEIALCYNGTGGTISKGSVVYISGAQGQRPRIDLANNVSEQGSSKVFGVAAENILDGEEGYVATFGVVGNIDTTEFTDGAVLWLSASAGKMTTTRPLSPNHLVFVGYCLKSNETSGRIFVSPQNGYELEELHDVLITNVLDNHIVTYNQSSSLWVNQGLATAIQEVDGAGSGIDADLLDTHHASYFINTSSATQTKEGNLNVHGVLVAHDLFVTGSTVYLNTTSLQVNDPVIYVGLNQYTSDVLDIGFIAPYGDITSSSVVGQHNHTGLIRDHVDKKWKLLASADHPINDLFDFSSPSVTYATLLVGAIETSSSAVMTNFNADFLDGFHATYFQDAATASATFAPINSPTFTGAMTINSSVVANTNIQFNSPSLGIVLKSPNNTSYLVTVNDDGSLTTTAL